MAVFINELGVQPHGIFSNPESRKQAIQQFSASGIDTTSRYYLPNTGNWDISGHGLEMPRQKEIIDDVEMKKGCIEQVRKFYDNGNDLEFADKGLEGRCNIILDFYEGLKGEMGIDAELVFENKPPQNLGGYNHATNRIELNSKYLENPDCENLLNTLIHESRHAFQKKCIDAPESVTVKDNIIDVWKDNFVNYISPEFDFEAYENQEIEKDANYYADSVMRKGMDTNYA